MADVDDTTPKTLGTVAEIMRICSVVVAIASAVVGLVLIVQTGACVSGEACTGSTHPFVWQGIGAAVGGFMFAALFAAVGHNARAVGELLARTRAAAVITTPGSGPS